MAFQSSLLSIADLLVNTALPLLPCANRYRVVFRSMISLANTPTQRDPITFTDKEVESGIVIRLFLDYIYTGQIKGIGHQDETNTILVLIEFAKKWECPTIFDTIEQKIRLNIGKVEYGQFEHFLMAVYMKNYELAGELLRIHPAPKWEPAESEQAVTNLDNIAPVSGFSVFDITTIDFNSYQALDAEVAWALLRSLHVGRENLDSDDFEKTLGDEFVRLMRIQRESHYLVSALC